MRRWFIVFLRLAPVLLSCLAAPAIVSAAEDDNVLPEQAMVEAPQRFSLDRLQPFTVSAGSSLTYGIDPETLSVGQDGVVRYVMVARSRSGALNVFYDGVRCQTAEVKTYARWDNNRSAWNRLETTEWKPLASDAATRPATVLAVEGLCDGKSANGDPKKILAALRTRSRHVDPNLP